MRASSAAPTLDARFDLGTQHTLDASEFRLELVVLAKAEKYLSAEQPRCRLRSAVSAGSGDPRRTFVFLRELGKVKIGDILLETTEGQKLAVRARRPSRS